MTKQDIQNLLNAQCRRAGLRVRAAVAARAPAAACRSSTCCAPSAIPRRPTRSPSRSSRRRMATGRFIVVQNSMSYPDAARAHHRRPRPRGGARRARQRYRHDARRARRRRVDLEVRPRQPQLRRRQPGARRRTGSTRNAWPVLRARRRRRAWCRCRRWCGSRPAPSPAVDRAVQPAELGDAVGAAAAGRDDGGGSRDPARDRASR